MIIIVLMKQVKINPLAYFFSKQSCAKFWKDAPPEYSSRPRRNSSFHSPQYKSSQSNKANWTNEYHPKTVLSMQFCVILIEAGLLKIGCPLKLSFTVFSNESSILFLPGDHIAGTAYPTDCSTAGPKEQLSTATHHQTIPSAS